MPPRWSSTDLDASRRALACIAVALPAIALAQSPMPVTRNTLVPFDNSPFPYRGIAPKTGKPFLDVEQGERRGRNTRARRRALGGNDLQRPSGADVDPARLRHPPARR